MAEHANLAIHPFFDDDSCTWSYVIAAGGECAIIDPVLGFNRSNGRTCTAIADQMLDLIVERAYTPRWILDTHVHADHMTAADYLRKRLPEATVAIGAGVTQLQQQFAGVFNLGAEACTLARRFDRLLGDEAPLKLGPITGRAMSTPGHTPACMTYLFGDCAFVGDTMFMPDYGSARCDFPGGDAATLHDSIQRIFALGDETRLFMCHDYAPGGREYRYETTVGEQRAHNLHLKDSVSREEFVEMRQERDAGLAMPALFIPSLQVNVRAGALPAAEENGMTYLKVPVDAF